MTRVCQLILFLVAAGAVAAPASAEEPYYFHKAGIGRDAYMDDVNDCAALAGGVRVAKYNAPYSANPNIYAAAISGFFIGLMQAAERRRIGRRVERTCMADKGYQRLSLDKETHRAVMKLDGDARLNRLFDLVADEHPTGKVLVE